jgi:hypothetical protein
MNAPKSAIAAACGLLLARGVPAGKVLEVESKLRRIAQGGLSATVELPEYGIAVTLPPPGGARRKHLQRPAGITR